MVSVERGENVWTMVPTLKLGQEPYGDVLVELSLSSPFDGQRALRLWKVMDEDGIYSPPLGAEKVFERRTW